MRRTSWVLGTTLAASAVILAACAPPGEGSGEQEESADGPGESTVQDVGNTECLVGTWDLDVQVYAESALRSQMSAMPVSDPIGGGTRVLRFEPGGNFDFESIDFSLTYTISIDGTTVTPTVTTNEHYAGRWAWAGDAESDELEFDGIGPIGDPLVQTSTAEGVELPGDTIPTPVIEENYPTPIVCEDDVLQINGTVPSLWFRVA